MPDHRSEISQEKAESEKALPEGYRGVIQKHRE
jgi:hypothetical protein